jgi:HEAT repeat protein
MNKSAIGAAGALLGVLVATVLFMPERPSDPVYRGRTVSAWVGELTSSDYRMRTEAGEAMRALGPAAIPHLTRALNKKNLPFRPFLVTIGRKVPFLSIPGADAMLVREHAAHALGDMGLAANAAIPELILALRNSNPDVLAEVERSLRKMWRSALPSLLQALTHQDARIRGGAAEVLKEFGEPAKVAMPALLARLRDESAAVRVRAATALGVLGQENLTVVKALVTALSDGNSDVRGAAAESLGRLGPAAKAAVAVLPRVLFDTVPAVRVRAAKAVWKISGESASVLPVLAEALRDRNVGWQAAFVIGEIGPPAAESVPALIEALKQEQVPRPLRTPPSSALALGRVGTAAVPRLIDTLKDSRASVRTSAVIALGLVGVDARAAAPALFELLKDKDAEVRSASALSLGAIDSANKNLVPVLKVLSREDDIYISSAAISALRRIDPAAAAEIGPE